MGNLDLTQDNNSSPNILMGQMVYLLYGQSGGL